MTQKEDILEYLKANPNSTPAEMVESLKIPKNSIGVVLNQLKKENLIESTEYGKYKVRGMLEKINLPPKTEEEKKQVPLPDLRNPDVILAYKDAYGKEAFLDILNKIKRLIE